MSKLPRSAASSPGSGLGDRSRTDDGVMIINLWENDEGRYAMARSRVFEVLAGGSQPAFEGYDVLD